jgi:hypothetical protein
MTCSPVRFPNGPLLASPGDLDEPGLVPEKAKHISGARVVLVDSEVLQHDFIALRTENLVAENPGLAGLAPTSLAGAVRDTCDRWLLANAALISAPQAMQSVTNTRIAIDGGERDVYRPPRYGRSLVAPVPPNRAASGCAFSLSRKPAGLLDLKGAGVAPGKIPSHAKHSDGLEYLAVALGDYLLKRMIDEIFRRAAPSCWTVPIYAILDLGFDIYEGWRGTAAAGMHVRRAHRRPRGGMMLPNSGSAQEIVQFEIEMILRSYGITSTTWGGCLEVGNLDGKLTVSAAGERITTLSQEETDYILALTGGAPQIRFDRVNVQIAREVSTLPVAAQMFDFGHINARAPFAFPVCSTVRDQPFCLGGILRPDHPAFIQPDPRLCLPFNDWDRYRINDFTFDLVERWRAAEIDTTELRWLLEEPIRRALAAWGDQ